MTVMKMDQEWGPSHHLFKVIRQPIFSLQNTFFGPWTSVAYTLLSIKYSHKSLLPQFPHLCSQALPLCWARCQEWIIKCCLSTLPVYNRRALMDCMKSEYRSDWTRGRQCSVCVVTLGWGQRHRKRTNNNVQQGLVAQLGLSVRLLGSPSENTVSRFVYTETGIHIEKNLMH